MDEQKFNDEQFFQDGWVAPETPISQQSTNPYDENTVSVNNYQDYTANPQYQYAPSQNQGEDNKTLSIAGLILGILSVVACCTGSSLMMGVGGIICSNAAKKKGPSGMATAGLVLSILGIILGVLFYIVYFCLVVLEAAI